METFERPYRAVVCKLLQCILREIPLSLSVNSLTSTFCQAEPRILLTAFHDPIYGDATQSRRSTESQDCVILWLPPRF